MSREDSKIDIVFRSIALFAILYQFLLAAGDLADAAVFSVTLFAAFAAAAFIAWYKKGGKPIPALIIIALIPWIARALIAMPRLFVSGTGSGDATETAAANLDSLLLNYDRNNFVSLLPFYWTAATTWFSIRSRKFLRAAVIADALILISAFTFTGVSDTDMYRWPIVMIVMLAGIVFMQALALLFSLPPELRLKRGEKIAAVAALLILVVAGGLLFLKPSQMRAAQKGGGLLEPKLFSFDFSQFLRLDSEISMNDDLILIVKKDPRDNHIMLRRSALSGYGKKQGFYRVEEIDEQTHPQRLPPAPVSLTPPEIKSARRVYQEYYLVNFDAAAFIGMKEPVEITPWETWDASSFKSAYAVESLTSNIDSDELAYLMYGDDLDDSWPGPEDLGLSEKEFALYTAYGGDERIKAFAEEITDGYDNYGDKVRMIHDRLKYGEYRYSLKPGIAPDGDQLAYFLFQSKKGYCSYYAFAMALMLRSLGIPARVAAGFFIDPESGVFDYYAVRSDMAHAWVEVAFPGYGWLEFDPTSQTLAAGEEFNFSSGPDMALLERLMREILENRSKLKAKTGQDIKDALTDPRSWAALSKKLLSNVLLPLLVPVIVIVFVLIRCGFLLLSFLVRNKRRKAIFLWKHTRRRIALAGLKCRGLESEWALQTDAAVKATYAMYLGAAAARFAPEYRDADFVSLQNTYREFSLSYREAVPRARRLLAWILPLACGRKPACGGKPAASARVNRSKYGLTLLLLLVFLAGADSRAQDDARDNARDPRDDADELYSSAMEAQYSEYWERAIDLYKEGSARYPDDFRFPWALGNLYFNRSLYGLAWDEYRKVEDIDPFNTYILSRMAYTAGYLNRDKTAVEYLERLLEIDPENKEVIGRLGWMYFKVHRLEEGKQLLVSAIEDFGSDPDLSMTLGTVYSDMYRYEEGKRWYKEAIAQSGRDYSFAAVAHYNLSILESRFYHYDFAMDEANASLDVQNRASGLLMRGELETRRLDLEKAQADFEAAREIDYSPLAKLNLAQVYRISGRLEEARLYALDCLKGSEHSWMLNYGIDPVRYKRDIYEILYKTYSALAKTEKFQSRRTPGVMIRSAFKSASHTFYAKVNRMLYQKYSLAAGDAYGPVNKSGAPPLDRYIQYYNAFETYPRRALFWLNKAQDFETAIIPAAQAAYDLERGILLKNINLAMQALEEFDPVWERDMISDCYREFALRGRTSSVRRAAAGELFAMNRGALLQEGISLPVEIRLYADDTNSNVRRSEKKLRRILSRTGFTAVNSTRFVLEIAVTALPSGLYSAVCELHDTEGAVNSLSRTIPLFSFSTKDICIFAETLSNNVFRVD